MLSGGTRSRNKKDAQRDKILEEGSYYIRSWQEQSAKRKAGEIAKADYDRWRYHDPVFDDPRIRAAIPPKTGQKQTGTETEGKRPEGRT